MQWSTSSAEIIHLWIAIKQEKRKDWKKFFGVPDKRKTFGVFIFFWLIVSEMHAVKKKPTTKTTNMKNYFKITPCGETNDSRLWTAPQAIKVQSLSTRLKTVSSFHSHPPHTLFSYPFEKWTILLHSSLSKMISQLIHILMTEVSSSRKGASWFKKFPYGDLLDALPQSWSEESAREILSEVT